MKITDTKRRSSGLCIRCGKTPRWLGTSQCEPCAMKARAWARKSAGVKPWKLGSVGRVPEEMRHVVVAAKAAKIEEKIRKMYVAIGLLKQQWNALDAESAELRAVAKIVTP